eukprot:10732806-Lingulodinium_polyedra.AAC.1
MQAAPAPFSDRQASYLTRLAVDVQWGADIARHAMAATSWEMSAKDLAAILKRPVVDLLANSNMRN